MVCVLALPATRYHHYYSTSFTVLSDSPYLFLQYTFLPVFYFQYMFFHLFSFLLLVACHTLSSIIFCRSQHHLTFYSTIYASRFHFLQPVSLLFTTFSYLHTLTQTTTQLILILSAFYFYTILYYRHNNIHTYHKIT